jgi:hypothetical protein
LPFPAAQRSLLNEQLKISNGDHLEDEPKPLDLQLFPALQQASTDFLNAFSNPEPYHDMKYECHLILLHSDQYNSNNNISGGPGIKFINSKDIPLPGKSLSIDSIVERLLEDSNVEQLKNLVKAFKESEPGLPVLRGNAKIANCTKRGSVYRGVSKNGKHYQVMVMNNNHKYFSGQIKSERLAARIYDRYALQTMGLRAKTNFNYTCPELEQIIQDIEEAQRERG